MVSDSAWNDMLDEFRTLGGTADNIRLADGPFGRGLFPIHPAKPVAIQIPANLLVSLDDVVIDNGAFRVAQSSPVTGRVRAFLEQYEREFSWGPGQYDTERFLQGMADLPGSVKEFLVKKFGFARFFNAITPDALKKWFFGTRVINRGEQQVIMPIIEMANHGGTTTYEKDTGVALNGTFPGEVLVQYAQTTDPLDMFLNWTFAPREETAFSIEMVAAGGRKEFEIRRNFHGDIKKSVVQTVAVQGDRYILEHLILGHQRFPRVPKGAFRRAIQGLSPEETDEAYDYIQFANRQAFLDLLDAIEGLNLAIVPPLRALAVNQLRALSHHFLVRQV
jgi:hypothetical protein